jgi:hypothetical protein
MWNNMFLDSLMRIRCAADYSAEQYMTLIEQQVATAQTLVDEVFSPASAPAG